MIPLGDFAMVTTTSALPNEIDLWQKQTWIPDSEATNHICNSRDLFQSFHDQLDWVQVGNWDRILACGTGNIRVLTLVEVITYTVLLTDAICASKMMFNLISMSRVRKARYEIYTDNDNQDPR